MEQEGPYKTVDIGLAASLMASGVEFAGALGEPGRQFHFCFSESEWERIREIEVSYHSGQLKIEVLSFLTAYRRLKGFIGRQRGRRDG